MKRDDTQTFSAGHFRNAAEKQPRKQFSAWKTCYNPGMGAGIFGKLPGGLKAAMGGIPDNRGGPNLTYKMLDAVRSAFSDNRIRTMLDGVEPAALGAAFTHSLRTANSTTEQRSSSFSRGIGPGDNTLHPHALLLVSTAASSGVLTPRHESFGKRWLINGNRASLWVLLPGGARKRLSSLETQAETRYLFCTGDARQWRS